MSLSRFAAGRTKQRSVRVVRDARRHDRFPILFSIVPAAAVRLPEPPTRFSLLLRFAASAGHTHLLWGFSEAVACGARADPAASSVGD